MYGHLGYSIPIACLYSFCTKTDYLHQGRIPARLWQYPFDHWGAMFNGILASNIIIKLGLRVGSCYMFYNEIASPL